MSMKQQAQIRQLLADVKELMELRDRVADLEAIVLKQQGDARTPPQPEENVSGDEARS